MGLLAEGAKRGGRSLSTVLLVCNVALSSPLVGGADRLRLGRNIVCHCSGGRVQAEKLDPSLRLPLLSPSLYPLLFIAGLFAATLTVSRVIHWVALIRISVGKLGGDFLGAPKRRLIWATPFLLLFHPTLYLVLGLLAASVLTIAGRLPAGWRWFMAGVYVYAVLGGLLVLNVMRKRRSRRNQHSTIDEPAHDRHGPSSPGTPK